MNAWKIDMKSSAFKHRACEVSTVQTADSTCLVLSKSHGKVLSLEIGLQPGLLSSQLAGGQRPACLIAQGVIALGQHKQALAVDLHWDPVNR